MTAGVAPVAVIIVSWNCRDHLDTCLASLRGLERSPQDVVVVDNASTDGTVAFVQQRYPEVRVLAQDANLGFCRANNEGIDCTTAPFVLVLNPDTRVEPTFVEGLLAAFEDPEVGIVSGKLLRFDGTTFDSAGQDLAPSRQPRDRGYGRPDRGQFDHDEAVFGACGAAALYRRAMLDDIVDEDGYFDATFFAFYEDLDLAWRARRRGWKAVYRHDAVAYHARGGTAENRPVARRLAAMLGRSPEVRYHIAKNRYLTILRNDSPGAYCRNLPFILARDVATAGLLLATSPGVLGRLWKNRSLFRRALEKGRLDRARQSA